MAELIGATNNAVMNDKRRSKLTTEQLKDSKRLKAIWDAKRPMSQEVFGEKYELGNQSNVGHYLNGRIALNLRAAMAFAKELGCDVDAFSPAIGLEMARLGGTLGARSPQANFAPRPAQDERTIKIGNSTVSLRDMQADMQQKISQLSGGRLLEVYAIVMSAWEKELPDEKQKPSRNEAALHQPKS